MAEDLGELERFAANTWRGHAPGLWLTLRIQLGSDADEVQGKFLDVIKSWLPISDAVQREHGFSPGSEAFPAPEELAPRLPKWFIDDFNAYSREEALATGWRYPYKSWILAMEERCWYWWSYERDGSVLVVQLQVDGFPCPTQELAYLARAAGAESVSVEV